MRAKLNESSEVKWQWLKKSYPAKVADIKLEGSGYVLLHDFKSAKVLAFRRPLLEDESVLPEGCEPIHNEEELNKCYNKTEERMGNYKNEERSERSQTPIPNNLF